MKKINKALLLALLAVMLALPLAALASTAEVIFGKLFTSTDTGDATGTTGASTFSAIGGAVAYSGQIPVIDFITSAGTTNRRLRA